MGNNVPHTLTQKKDIWIEEMKEMQVNWLEISRVSDVGE